MCLFISCGNHRQDHAKTAPLQLPNLNSADSRFVEFSSDSSFKVVYDTMLHFWNCKSGIMTREFDPNESDSVFISKIKYIVIHPSGKFIVIIDEDGILSAWNVKKGSCLRTLNDASIWNCSHLEFSDDGKFLMSIDYAEATVDIYGWPKLNYLATGEMGRYRNSFNWENKNGKLIFYYKGYDGDYKTVFPVETPSGKFTFKKYRLNRKN